MSVIKMNHWAAISACRVGAQQPACSMFSYIEKEKTTILTHWANGQYARLTVQPGFSHPAHDPKVHKWKKMDRRLNRE